MTARSTGKSVLPKVGTSPLIARTVGSLPDTLIRTLYYLCNLGRRFDFMRIDLYDVDGGVSFGEITPYPDGG